jgi:hypothetical protein
LKWQQRQIIAEINRELIQQGGSGPLSEAVIGESAPLCQRRRRGNAQRLITRTHKKQAISEKEIACSVCR